jgi:hypothetical protein
LHCRQKSGDARLSHVEPSQVLFDKSIEDSVARTPRLKLSKHKKEEKVETVGDPVEGCETGENYAESGDVAHKLVAVY